MQLSRAVWVVESSVMPDSTGSNSDTTESTRDDFLPAASLETLKQRSHLLCAVRRFFESRDYLEVETPILSYDVVVDAFLEPFTTQWRRDAVADSKTSGQELFLQTSPEFGMKRLLCAGATSIYQITRAFRNGETGRYHNPEFTIVEWYRVGETHHEQMQLVEELVVEVFLKAETLRVQGSGLVRVRQQQPERQVLVEAPFERLTYDEAFETYAGRRVIGLHTSELAKLARLHHVVPPASLDSDDCDGWLNLLLSELVEPHLGMNRPTFLYDYPASQGALARVRDDAPPVAERFELYVCGIEVCNGYHELTDPRELRARAEHQLEVRAKAGLCRLPVESRLLAAMRAGLPACAGVALGFDRLVMLALGRDSLNEVIAFPIERA